MTRKINTKIFGASKKGTLFNIKNTTRFVFGGFILFIGVFALMIKFDIIQISFWKILDVFWPVGLILAGVFLMFRKKAFAFFIVMVTLILALFSNIYVFESSALSESVKINNKELVDNSITKINYELNFGVGSMKIYSGFNEDLYNLDVNTFYPDRGVEILVESEDNEVYVDIDRKDNIHFDSLGELLTFKKQREDWELFLNPSVPIDVDINFGASEVILDLSELMVENLDLNFGASSTIIVFGEFPTKTDIDMGASALELKFPIGYQVLIDIDSGLDSTNFVGFVKSGNSYKTENFKYDEEYIYINVDAGASDVMTGFY
jgi:hypothetical protein